MDAQLRYVPAVAGPVMFLAEPEGAPYAWQESDLPLFPPADPRGLIAAAGVELEAAWQMLELLLQLTQDARENREISLCGLHEVVGLVQQHVGAGQQRLHDWRRQESARSA